MTGTDPETNTHVSPKVTLILVSLVQFMVPFLMSAVGIALPAIGRDLGASAVQLSLVQTAQILGIGIFLLPAGRFADIHGRKRIFISGAVLLCCATLIVGTVGHIKLFIGLRFVQGIGAAMIFSTSLAILTAIFPPARRGRALGIVVCMVYLGMAAGPVVSGFIIHYLSWRWVFFFISGIMLITLILSTTGLKGEWFSGRGEPFDWVGSAVYMASLFMTIYGAAGLYHFYWARWLALAGVSGMIVFVVLQRRSAYPILDIHLLISNLPFTFANMATFINYAAAFSCIFFFSLYLQYIKGLPPQHAGMLLIIQPLVQATLAPVAGRLSDSYPPERIATIGMAFCTAGLIAASTINSDSSLFSIIIITVLFGISLGLFSTPNTTAIMSMVEPRHLGTASSMIGTMRTTGVLAGTTIIAMIFSMYMGNQQVTQANTGVFLQSQQTSFYIFSAMSLVGTLFSMAKGKLATSISSRPGKN